jgi:hypothetical protein
MGLGLSLFLFVCGLLTGHFIPRIPMLTITRLKSFNQVFPSHPRPIPVDGYLLARVLHMRTMRRWGLIFAIIPLGFGWMMLKWSTAMFGMGMFLAGGWTLISWLLPSTPFTSPSPWTRSLAEQLQLVRNQAASDSSCCDSTLPEWEMTAVRCRACRATLLKIPRPDLGRPRLDGKIMGLVRLWISDGNAIIIGEEE